MAISALELYKQLPRTDCGECGKPTCMAFATHVIVEGEELARCPYLSEALRARAAEIAAQQQQGVGRRRELPTIALKHLQEKAAPLDFAALAPGLGAASGEEGGRGYLRVRYFGCDMLVFKDEVRYPDGLAANPWDAILLYNYIASEGNRPLTGDWVTFETLPNSVSKTKTLRRLAASLAQHFAGKARELGERGRRCGGEPAATAAAADLQMVFHPLPRVPILLIFHDAEPEEDFPAQAHFLFDAQVMTYLDLESLLFLVERLMDRMRAST